MVDESDIDIYDSSDFEVQVDGVPVLGAIKFEVTPEFAGEDDILDGIDGETGFSQNEKSSKAMVKVTVKGLVGASIERLDQLALDRTIVSAFLVAFKNADRYPVKSRGVAFGRVRPGVHTVEKGKPQTEYEIFGFGYRQSST